MQSGRQVPRGDLGALVRFFGLTLALTWAVWAVSGALVFHGPAPASGGPSLAGALFLLGVFVPGIVALGLTARSSGRAGVWALLQQIGRWRVGVRWYLFAAGYMVAIKLSVALVHRVATGDWPRFGETRWVLMAVATLVSTWAQAGEELGWRGYALPRLAARIGLARGSILLGVIWAVWHVPLFLVPGGDTYGQSFPLYLIQVTAISVAMAWLYWRSGGSLLLVMLLHAAVNNTKDIVPSVVPGAMNPLALSTSLTAWLTVAALWVGAAYFLYRMRGVPAKS